MLQFKKQSNSPVLAPEFKMAENKAPQVLAIKPEYSALKVIDTAVSEMVNATQFKSFMDRTTAVIASVINTLSKPQESIHRTRMI